MANAKGLAFSYWHQRVAAAVEGMSWPVTFGRFRMEATNYMQNRLNEATKKIKLHLH